MSQRSRLLTIVIVLLPMLTGMALQQPTANPGVAAGSVRAKVTNPHGNLSTPCQNCHTNTSWKPIRSIPEFNHDTTRYPLRGMHKKVGCIQCHASLNFKDVSTTCADCHADIHRRQFGANCEKCHTVQGWKVSLDAIQNHNNRFPLVGAHALVQCDQCHKGAGAGQFAGLSTACYSCHQQDYLTPVLNHVTLKFPTTCESCHTVNTWFGAKFDHLQYTGFALTGMHATLACSDCHANNVFNKSTPATCYSTGCHKADYDNSNNPPHARIGLPKDCAICHSTTNWLNAAFDHTLYAHYPLTGMHATVTCAACHTNNNYSSTPTACYSCHQASFTGTTNPNHVTAGFPTDCSMCHTTSGWTTSSFNHAAVFPLTGFHATVPCAQCHTNNNYTTIPTDCYSCHKADWNGTNAPPHAAVNFPTTCGTCHTTTAWTGVAFDHSTTTFPLTGFHVSVPCAQCHTNNNYTTIPTDCFSCHKADWNGTNAPPHAAANFPITCATCHTTTAWTGVAFDHNKTTFPLTGFHATVGCAQCHVNNNYTTLPTTCYGCHQKDFTATTNPPHVASNFPTDCTVCHNTASWTTSTFNHNNTAFPLTGFHVTVACATCHVNNNYTTLPTDCYSCHTADWKGTNNPPHATSGFPTTCATCHSTTDWTGATFNHNTTAFPLTGAHTTVACATCHVNNNYTTLPTTCYGCHQASFTGTTNPAHVAGGFPTDCTLCHSTTTWTTSTFNHATVFPLTGAHTTVACATCHVNNNYTTLPTTCYGCHQASFTGTTNPAHVAGGFPTDCTLCHSTTTWTTSTFNHATVFPLTGFHATMPCAQCHTNNNYTTLPTTCYGCHTADFTGTANPSHVAAAFPTTCDTCHTTTDWTSSITFNHTLYGNWALTGVHATTPCASCHTNNNYTLTSTACYSCHQTNFTGTTNPNHVTAGFPTDCSICHSTTNWTTSTFNHSTTTFPLTGFHATMQCVQCHTSASTYNGSLPTLCYGCHTADWNGTNNPAHAAAGFPTTCDTCHTTTNWAGATFNHNNTPFPLTGAHTTVACNLCHINNVFVGTPTDCYSCHTKDFTGTTNPNHVTVGWPTTCTTCHTTTAWLPATLPASYHTFFSLTHGRANSVCTACHTNSSDYSVFQCTGCHGNNNAASFSHPNVNGYVYNSANCYACHKNGSGG